MRVLVTGGTGRLGRALVPLLSGAGHDVRILSRVHRTGPGLHQSCIVGDLTTGVGLSEAVGATIALIVGCPEVFSKLTVIRHGKMQ